MAVGLEEGNEIDGRRSRRAGIIRLVIRVLTWILDLIGPIGALIIGGISILLGLVFAFQRVSNPNICYPQKRKVIQNTTLDSKRLLLPRGLFCWVKRLS